MPNSYAYIARVAPIEPLLNLQEAVRQAFGNTTEYVPVEEFHITLVYCYGETPDGLIEPLSWSRPGFADLIETLDFFDTEDGYAIHARVRKSAALYVNQEELALAAQDHGYELSPFSKPSDYKPHITLAYAPKPIEPMSFDPIPIKVTAIELSGENYEVIAMQQLKEKTEAQADKGYVKFTQAEVKYDANGGTLNPRSQACSTCRWFHRLYENGQYLGHDCQITESYPAEILPTGWCDQWSKTPQIETPVMPSIQPVVIVENVEVEIDTGERAIGIAASTPMPAVDTRHKRWTRFMRPREPFTPGFKIQKNTWIAVFSNQFEDKDKEFFPEKAIDDYVFRVDSGIVPLPKLVVWHEVKSTEIGAADWVARIGSFLVAAGKFHEDARSQRAKAYYQRNLLNTKHSHGFFYEVAQFKDRAYWQFNTFEISLLPKGVEANPYTTFGA